MGRIKAIDRSDCGRWLYLTPLCLADGATGITPTGNLPEYIALARLLNLPSIAGMFRTPAIWLAVAPKAL